MSQQLTIRYYSCGGESYSILTFDFCYYVVVTHFASVYVFNDCTSHLLSLSNLGIQCVYLDKDKGLPNRT